MISFVILHYKNLDDTLNCIKSIKELDDQDKISLIIVDNNSFEKEEIKTLKEYTEDIVLLKDNLGVAKAYNEGAIYAINKYQPDYVCVMNNDILINQKDFVKRVEDSYKDKSFDMLGTKIICEGESVNPFPVYDSLEKINNQIEKNKKLINIYSSKLKGNLLELYFKVKYTFKKRPEMLNGDKKEEGCALHGCLIIFSKKYYKKEKNVMVPDTFLFHEEEFLYFRMKQKNYISVYDPSLEIIHLEGSAMKQNNKNIIDRKLFKLKECNKSLNILKNKLENNEEL
jgi:GT2 family glycosyltransferase